MPRCGVTHGDCDLSAGQARKLIPGEMHAAEPREKTKQLRHQQINRPTLMQGACLKMGPSDTAMAARWPVAHAKLINGRCLSSARSSSSGHTTRFILRTVKVGGLAWPSRGRCRGGARVPREREALGEEGGSKGLLALAGKNLTVSGKSAVQFPSCTAAARIAGLRARLKRGSDRPHFVRRAACTAAAISLKREVGGSCLSPIDFRSKHPHQKKRP